MKIGISNDHSAVQLKFEVMNYLQSKGYEVVNYGTDSTESYDYPVAGKTLAYAVKNKEVDFGIAICGTGIGISLACNKVKGIRAACVSEPVSAALTRSHNNANVICFGARIVGVELAKSIVDAFLETPFSNGERHQRRIDMISAIEEEQ